MNETILVPLDGSSLAEQALPYARMLAVASGARIRLFRVVPVPGLMVGDREADEAKAMREAETYLADVTTIMQNVSRTRFGRRAETSLAGVATRGGTPPIVETATFAGEPAASIFEEIHERNIDLIVMSTHGRSGLGRWVYGSVADQIMRLAPVPVLLVPAVAPTSWPTDRALRLLIPLDGSELAQEALGPTWELAKTLHAEIQLLQVMVPLTYTYADPAAYTIDDHQIENAHRYLEKVANELGARGLKVTTFDAIGPAALMIAATAREQGSDLIAMSTHGSGGVTRLLMGSVATGVVQRASVPVLIVRPEAARVLAATPVSGLSARRLALGI
jgi:nucleotide-binding universal stress UspA family protein